MQRLQWLKVARIQPLVEMRGGVRWLAWLAGSGLQVAIYVALWRSVLVGTENFGGMEVSSRQAITYSAIAVLLVRIRWSARLFSRNSLLTSVREKTVAYWLVRPLEPQRYYWVKAIGEMAWGASWALAASVVLWLAGVLQMPSGAWPLAIFAASSGLGLALAYYSGAVLDLISVWVPVNGSIARTYYFVQDVLGGALVPLWLLPGTVRQAAVWLPFSYMINVPADLGAGLTGGGAAIADLVVGSVWCVIACVGVRVLWHRAIRRLESVAL